MFIYYLYFLVLSLLLVSFFKDKTKTKTALKKAWKSFENILPQFLAILLTIGLILSIADANTISKIIGKESGWAGMIIASLVGSVTLIPGFIAFPLAAALVKNGAGFMQIAVFISTLMMVGIVTLPLEIKYFGKKVAIFRNGFAFLFSFLVAIVIGLVLI